MAAWQFDGWLSPRDTQLEAANYWPDAEQANAVLTDVARILPEITNYWNATGKAWGRSDSNIIEVYFDGENVQHISFRVDLMEPYERFVYSIIRLCEKHDLQIHVLVGNEPGLLPDEAAFLQELDASTAAHYVRVNPRLPEYLGRRPMKIVTFGEIMMRLATPERLRFSQTQTLEMTYGGGEANVAVSLCNYGLDAAFVTKLPKNPFGEGAIQQLRGLGVDTTKIARGGERIGIYFLETGASQRASVVVYDRANSAISGVKAGEFDWDAIFEGAGWFHFTGITPALGPDVAAATKEAAKAAKEKGLTVSCDLNYRKKLWTPAEAKATMSEIMEFVDVAIGNEEDAEKVFGIKAHGSNVTGGEVGGEGYEQVARELASTYGFNTVAITLRESFSADHNGWSAMLLHEGQILNSKKYDLQIVDRVGGGDSFAGGLIYGLATGKSGQDALEFAVAASCLKHSISGDFNLVSVAEVEALMGGDGSGRVQR